MDIIEGESDEEVVGKRGRKKERGKEREGERGRAR